MGQAKARGNQEQRIAQALEGGNAVPEEGLYISTTPPGMRFIVEEVTVLSPEENEGEEGFFLVTVVDEASADDFEAMRDEFDPDEWRNFVTQYGLISH